MLSDERLKEIQKRTEKATEGPWKAGEGFYNRAVLAIGKTDTYDGPVWSSIFRADLIEAQDAEGRKWYTTGSIYENVDFIAHARQDIPDLLAEIDRLKAELNGAYERAAQAKPVESETHLLQDSGYTRGWTDCNRAKATAIRNLKEPT
jgi:hypothetical protein